jgi:hypothetical protein
VVLVVARMISSCVAMCWEEYTVIRAAGLAPDFAWTL